MIVHDLTGLDDPIECLSPIEERPLKFHLTINSVQQRALVAMATAMDVKIKADIHRSRMQHLAHHCGSAFYASDFERGLEHTRHLEMECKLKTSAAMLMFLNEPETATQEKITLDPLLILLAETFVCEVLASIESQKLDVGDSVNFAARRYFYYKCEANYRLHEFNSSCTFECSLHRFCSEVNNERNLEINAAVGEHFLCKLRTIL